jgi:hypothetical protein
MSAKTDRLWRIDRLLRKAGIITQAQLLKLSEDQLREKAPNLNDLHIKIIKATLSKNGYSLKEG